MLHVVTLIETGNPFGGPVVVALGQADELARRGHDVQVLAGTRGKNPDFLPERAHVYLYRLRRVLPGAGFSGLASLGLLRFLRARRSSFDVVHIHVARDLVTLPVAFLARRAGIPYVLQPHGMVDGSKRVSAAALDRVMTRRVFRGASSVFTLTPRESSELQDAIGSCAVVELPNGVDVGNEPSRRPSIVSAEVLFCGRLAPRKRPEEFARAARRLTEEGCSARFSMVGPDGGSAASALNASRQSDGSACVTWEGAVDPTEVRGRMERSDVFVLTAIDEPFGMVVIEAMSVACPVIVMASCGLAEFVLESGGGLVVPDDDPVALDRAIRSLIDSPELRHRMGRAGREAVHQRFSIASVCDRLEQYYVGAISAHASLARSGHRR